MKNITLALDEKTIKAGREYARKHNMTLNALVRKLLDQTVSKEPHEKLEEWFTQLDKMKPSGPIKKWKREDLYRG